jgi:hypothetical protein
VSVESMDMRYYELGSPRNGMRYYGTTREAIKRQRRCRFDEREIKEKRFKLD